jgi:hypothetical protein
MVKLYKYYTDSTAPEESAEASSRRRHPRSPHHGAAAPRKNSNQLAVVMSTNPDNVEIPPAPLPGIKEESARINSQVSEPSMLDNSAMEKAKSSQKSRNSVSNLLSGGEEEEESKVGAAMSDITTKRVIVLVLVMLICIPLMTFTPSDFSPSFGTSLLHEMVKSSLVSPNATGQGSPPPPPFAPPLTHSPDWSYPDSNPSGERLQQPPLPGVEWRLLLSSPGQAFFPALLRDRHLRLLEHHHPPQWREDEAQDHREVQHPPCHHCLCSLRHLPHSLHLTPPRGKLLSFLLLLLSPSSSTLILSVRLGLTTSRLMSTLWSSFPSRRW